MICKEICSSKLAQVFKEKFWPRHALWPDLFWEVRVLARLCLTSPGKSRIKHCSILGPKGLTGASAVPSGSKSPVMNFLARTLCYVLPGYLCQNLHPMPSRSPARGGEDREEEGDGRKHLQHCSVHSLWVLSVPLKAGSMFIQ